MGEPFLGQQGKEYRSLLCLWNTLRSFHGNSRVAGTRAYKPKGDSRWIDDLGWGGGVAFLLPGEGKAKAKALGPSGDSRSD